HLRPTARRHRRTGRSVLRTRRGRRRSGRWSRHHRRHLPPPDRSHSRRLAHLERLTGPALMNAAYFIVGLPLAGFVLLCLFGKRLGDPLAGWLATAAIGGAFVAAIITFASLLDRTEEARSVTKPILTWFSVGGFQVKAAILADPLSITMALFVTGVGSLIHLYSIGYMKGDPQYHRFFVYMNLFAFSMLTLVLA